MLMALLTAGGFAGAGWLTLFSDHLSRFPHTLDLLLLSRRIFLGTILGIGILEGKPKRIGYLAYQIRKRSNNATTRAI